MEPRTNQRSGITLLLFFGGLFLLFFGLVVSAATVLGGRAPGGPAVGVVELKGTIEDARRTMEAMRTFVEDEEIKGIVVRVDSPGGSVGPTQEIYREVLRARAKKKVVASLAGVAASGGYYAICGADRIIANPGTLTGSIGVITEIAHVEGILELLHIETESFKSGELKDSGSPLRSPTDADRNLFTGLVANVHQQFQQAVQKERKLSEEMMAKIQDGRVLTGEQAKDLGLVDDLGNLHDAVGVLQELAGIEGRPRLVYPGKKAEEFLKELIDKGVAGTARALTERLMPRVEYRMPSRFR